MSWTKGQAYAQDLRDRVLAAPGLLREVAARFEVSQAYVCRVRARCNRLGLSSAGTQRNHMPLRLAGVKEALRAQVAQAPEQTLLELCQWCQAEHGIKVAVATMHKTLARLELTLKKKERARGRANAPRCGPGARGLGGRAAPAASRATDLSR